MAGVRSDASIPERRDIGFGVHVTRGVDGVFIHFKSPSGRGMGFCVDETSQSNLLGRETLHEWALAILENHETLTPLS
jgi:hypothetical protein